MSAAPRNYGKKLVKGLMRKKQWSVLGSMFCFTPKFHPGGHFDWRSAPPLMMQALNDPPRPRTNGLRHRLYAAQEGLCFYCGNETPFNKWTIDHLIPRCRGGGALAKNKVGACANCNGRKGCLTEKEFREAGIFNTTRLKGLQSEIQAALAGAPSRGIEESLGLRL